MCWSQVPADVPQVPLQRDIEQQQKSLRLKPEAASKLLALDLRKDTDLARSHFLHRLRLLGIEWGVRATDAQRNRGTFRESWQLQWSLSWRCASSRPACMARPWPRPPRPGCAPA